MENAREVLLEPCHHMVLCLDCLQLVKVCAGLVREGGPAQDQLLAQPRWGSVRRHRCPSRSRLQALLPLYTRGRDPGVSPTPQNKDNMCPVCRVNIVGHYEIAA